MNKEQKNQTIDALIGQLSATPHFYLADISNLSAEHTSKLRRQCYGKNIQLQVVKNTLLTKALERSEGRDYSELLQTKLKGATAIFFSESGSEPAKLIKEFRKTSDRPVLKAAYVEESVYIGDNQIDVLASIKNKNELIGDIIGLLQSPMQNVLSGLQNSGGNTIAGLVKTMSEKPE